MVQAVIFDFDGTLVDSEHLHCLALSKAIKANTGIYVSPEQVGLLAGMTYTEKAKILLKDKGSFDIEKITTDAYEHFLSIALDKIKLRRGAKRFIKAIRSLGLKIGLYSPNKKDFLISVLSKFDLLKYFDVVVGREDVVKPKPDPEGYILAARKLGVKPEDCLVFEDTPTGFTSAKQAGMKVITLHNPYLKDPEYPGATMQIRDYKEITKELLKSL
jgi:HAD superfamily hydrolase (TIGR01509 family)